MKKIFLSTILIIAGAVFCSCSSFKTSKSSAEDAPQPETTTVEMPVTSVMSEATSATSETAVTTTQAAVKKIKIPTKDNVLYDNAGVLDNAGKKNIQQLLDNLNAENMLDAAFISTDDLGGGDPYAYAETAYKKIFKESSNGVLLLINNDTNEDILYKYGNISNYINGDAETTAFNSATKKIVSGNYEEAAIELLSLAKKAPSHIFDYAGVFTPEQLSELEKLASESKEPVSLAAVSGTDDIDYGKKLAKRRYPDGKGTLILYNTAAHKFTIHSEKQVGKDMKNAVASANKMSGDAYKKSLTVLGGK